MSDLLPQYVNPWLLYRHNETVRGTLSLAAMPNLRDSQNRDDALAQVTLSVKQREDGQIVLDGEASIELALTCQRCLKPLIETFLAPVHLVLVKYERQLASVNDDDDAIVCEEHLLLAPLIEQELILALPMIAKHNHCEASYDNATNNEAERQHPFANLKDLLN